MMIKLKPFDKRAGGAGSANPKFSSGEKMCGLDIKIVSLIALQEDEGGVNKGLKQSLPKFLRI